MDFHDFPRILGKSGVYLIHPPKICAGLCASEGASAPGAVSTRLLGHHGLAGEVHEATGREQHRALLLLMAGQGV